MSPSPCWAVSDTNKLKSCSLQLFLSTMQRSFFFSSLKMGLWDFLNKYSASSPEQNGSESKTAGFWICSVPLFFYVTSSKSIMIGIKSKLEGTVLKPRTTFTFLRGWSMKIQWQIHFSYAELWLWRICKDRRGQRWEDNNTVGYTSLFLIGSTPPPSKQQKAPKTEQNHIKYRSIFSVEIDLLTHTKWPSNSLQPITI